jgi:hypothetical protein
MSTLIASRGTIAARQMWSVYKAQGHLVAVTLRTRGIPTTDYETGAVTQSTTDRVVQGMLCTYKNQEIDGARIYAGDQRVYLRLADLATMPTLRDQVVLDGAVWAVVGVEDTASGAILDLQIRRPGEGSA